MDWYVLVYYKDRDDVEVIAKVSTIPGASAQDVLDGVDWMTLLAEAEIDSEEVEEIRVYSEGHFPTPPTLGTTEYLN